MLKIIEVLRSEYKSEYSKEMPPKDYVLPKIYHGGKDFNLSKRWYVYYSYRNPDTGQMERQPPIYPNVNREFSTKKERLSALKKIQKNLTELLKNGRSPYRIEEERNYTIKSALKWALEIKLNLNNKPSALCSLPIPLWWLSVRPRAWRLSS